MVRWRMKSRHSRGDWGPLSNRGNPMNRIARTLAGVGLAFAATFSTAATQEPESCRLVRFSDVGWTDITATTALATTVLEALGYETDVKVLSVPVTYASLANNDLDVF